VSGIYPIFIICSSLLKYNLFLCLLPAGSQSHLWRDLRGQYSSSWLRGFVRDKKRRENEPQKGSKGSKNITKVFELVPNPYILSSSVPSDCHSIVTLQA